MVTTTTSLNDLVLPLFQVGILLVLFFYAIFALLILKQVSSMSKTLKTPFSPLIKGLAIVHAGLAIGFVVLVFGLLRGSV